MCRVHHHRQEGRRRQKGCEIRNRINKQGARQESADAQQQQAAVRSHVSQIHHPGQKIGTHEHKHHESIHRLPADV